MWCVDGVARKLCARWNVLNSSPTDCRVWTRSSLDIHLPFRRGRVRATAMYIAKLVHIARTHSTGLLLSLAAQCTVHKVGPPWGINKVQPSTKPIQSILPSSFLPAPSLIHSRFVLFYFIWAVFKLMATCNYGLLYRSVAQCIWTSCRSCLLAMDCFCLTLWMPLS